MSDVQQQTLTRSAKRRLQNPERHLARILERGIAYCGQKGPTARPDGVRVAGVQDEAQLVELLIMEGEEHAFAPTNPEKLRAAVLRGTRPSVSGLREAVIGIIPLPSGRIIASVGINIYQPWYTDTWFCEEVWSFVHPDHRKAKDGYANKLIDFSMWFAEHLGMPLYMGVFSTKRTLGKVRLYARRAPFVGGIFLHNPVQAVGQ